MRRPLSDARSRTAPVEPGNRSPLVCGAGGAEGRARRASALKVAGVVLFDYHYERPARKHFPWWQGWAVRSRLRPMIDVKRMSKRRLEITVTYLRHCITKRGPRIDYCEDAMG